MKEDIVLIGSGGHCHAILDVILSTSAYNIVGIMTKEETNETNVLGYPIIGSDKDLSDLSLRYKNFAIAVGQIKNAKTRKRIYHNVKEVNGSLPVIVSPQAYVAKGVTIGEGTVVMHHAMVNSNAKLGVNNIINTKSLIEHDSVLGNHNHIATSAILNGNSIVENETFVGSGTVVNNGSYICSEVIIGSGSLVINDIMEKGTYAGSPVKLIKELDA